MGLAGGDVPSLRRLILVASARRRSVAAIQM